MIHETWTELLTLLSRLGLAFVLGLPVGWERERRARGPGLRTFPLVGLGACAYVLIGGRAFADSEDAQARVLQALLTGVGFIAGGAILKRRAEVHGIATAVGVWITAAIGAAVAYGYPLLAVMLSLITLLTLHLLKAPRSVTSARQGKGKPERERETAGAVEDA
ncbi:MgtC/SapB family protein [Hyalangium sp.]|uniref:MgtC/SapB family protein n=1 Tax=Hyalangium sp. TaxID=2028555 RepID=UPI002D685870|nr:MgtC/SapB family protein [Hyalangium sp.]HYH95430.1 MgtC/SapB family protein [Hyalangium sp.]